MDFNKLWQNFLDTIQNHYVDFNGRVGRAQFWYFILVYAILYVGVAIIASVTVKLIGTLFALGMLLPNLGMTIRRLHDTGKPGIWVLLALVPAVLMILMAVTAVLGGALGLLGILLVFSTIIMIASLACLGVLIYFCAQPGDAGDNAFGAPPPAFNPAP